MKDLNLWHESKVFSSPDIHIDPDCHEKLHCTFLRPSLKYFDFTSSYHLYFVVALCKHSRTIMCLFLALVLALYEVIAKILTDFCINVATFGSLCTLNLNILSSKKWTFPEKVASVKTSLMQAEKEVFEFKVFWSL